MIIVHHLNNSRSQCILWLLEELGLENQVKRYERDPKTMLAPASLRQVHPLGKSPIITDGELVLAESGAIVEYLVDRYGKGRLAPPPETSERLRYTYWLHYAEGSAMPFFIRPIARNISGSVKSSFIVPQLSQHLNYLEAELGKSLWFVGDEFRSGCPDELSARSSGGAGRFRHEPTEADGVSRSHSHPSSLPEGTGAGRRVRSAELS